jgi:hypothetical protein
MLIWLNDRSDAATSFAKDFLLHHSGVGNDINGNPKAYTASGLMTIFAGPTLRWLWPANRSTTS